MDYTDKDILLSELNLVLATTEEDEEFMVPLTREELEYITDLIENDPGI